MAIKLRIRLLPEFAKADERGVRSRVTTHVRLAAFLFVVALTTIPAFAQPTSEANELWPELDAYVHLNEKSRLLVLYSSTRKDDLDTRATWSAGGFVDLYFHRIISHNDRQHPDSARKRVLLFRAGYIFSPTPAGAPKPANQHIPTLLADTRFSIPGKLLLAERNRFDLRIINGDFIPRYRNRLTLERPFKTGPFELAPYLQTEVTYDWKYDAFNRVRYTAGVDWTATRIVVLESYYTRQRDTRSSPHDVNALGLTLQLHLGGTSRNTRKP